MRMQLDRRLDQLDRIFAAVGDLVREYGLAADAGKELCVIAEELFTNQVRHARPGGPTIEVALELRDGEVWMEIVDDDVEPWDPTAAPEVDVRRPVDERSPGGLGIHFVRTLSDRFEWTYDARRRRSRITVTRRLER